MGVVIPSTTSLRTLGEPSGVTEDSLRWLLLGTITVVLLLRPVIHLFRPGNGIQLVDLTEKTEGQIKTSKLQKTKKYYKKKFAVFKISTKSNSGAISLDSNLILSI